MTILRRVLTLFAVVVGLGAAAPALAEESLPDLGDSAAAMPRSAAAALKEDAVCTRCHDETDVWPVLEIYQTPHGVKADARTPTCIACHGKSEKHLHGDPNQKHRAAPDIVFGQKGYAFPVNDAHTQNGACLTCHQAGLRVRWAGSQHETHDLPCAACHKIHAKTDPMLNKVVQKEVCFTCHKEQRADTHKISTHPLDAGKIGCSDCHNPHGSPGPKLLKMASVTETCFTCHAEKRGPFLWEHQPVNEDCTNCHTPHGSNITPLLKSRPPFLCDDCHDGPHNSQAPYGTGVAGIQGGGVPVGGAPNSNAVGRACMNCHVMIHGSNSPAGAYLHR
jgi:DmsE family decaheme c-type cytochrome